jgi:Ser/Thr protein kinase RdoA (MazF antagonist)
MDAFAEFHAFWWDHPALGDVDTLPNQTSVAEHVANTRKHFDPFVDVLGDRLSGPQRRVYERTLVALPGLWERVLRGKDLTLIHGDANFSNVLLPRDPDRERALIIDWQLWGVSFAAEDLSHLMALHWDREQRRRMEKNLLIRYHRGLARHGVENYTWADCWEDYRLAVLLRVLFMPMWFQVSGAPDAWWKGSLNRAMQAVQDLDCLELLER